MSNLPPVNSVALSSNAKALIAAEIDQDRSLETGGILLGVRPSSGVAHVESATGPGPAATKARSAVDFDARFLQAEQDRLMAASPGLCFLGDWHFHPRGRGKPSRKDIRALEALRSDPDYQLGAAAFILIATPARNGLRFSGHRLRRPGSVTEIPVVCAD